MILTELMGGLGNQLFQIFAGISLALDIGSDYRFCDKFYYNTPKKVTKRLTYWENFLSDLKDKVLNINEDKRKYNIYLYENARKYKQIPKNNNLLLKGYFQSYKYFENNYEKIIEILNIRDKQEIVKKKYDYDYDNICSIHFRYGDYKQKKKYHINLDKNYYKKSVDFINAKKYLIFYEKEDKELVENIINYIKKDEVDYIYIDTSIPDYEQLLIMSLCKDNIIGNSTFSWFGAYFNKREDKRVVQPSKTIHKENNIYDLSPNEWITIEI